MDRRLFHETQTCNVVDSGWFRNSRGSAWQRHCCREHASSGRIVSQVPLHHAGCQRGAGWAAGGTDWQFRSGSHQYRCRKCHLSGFAADYPGNPGRIFLSERGSGKSNEQRGGGVRSYAPYYGAAVGWRRSQPHPSSFGASGHGKRTPCKGRHRALLAGRKGRSTEKCRCLSQAVGGSHSRNRTGTIRCDFRPILCDGPGQEMGPTGAGLRCANAFGGASRRFSGRSIGTILRKG